MCLAQATGECTITEPDHTQFCAGQADTANCARYRDFEALYNRGEDELEDRTDDAKTQTNSVVFNAFIWLQVRDCIVSACVYTEHVHDASAWLGASALWLKKK